MKSITIVAEDRIGLLADISYILGKCNVNIEALGVDVVGEKAIVALTVQDARKTSDILTRNGFAITQSEALVVKLPNKPGALNQLTMRLAEEKVSVENIHLLSSDNESGVFALLVNKPRKAVRMLSQCLIGNAADAGF